MRWSRAAALMGLVAIGAGSPACGGAANDDQAAMGSAPVAPSEPAPAPTSEAKVAEGASPDTGPGIVAPIVAAAPSPPEPVAAPFDVDRFVASLPEGAIAFNAPDTLELDERVRVRLVVQPGASEAELKVEHAAGASPAEQGEVQTASTVIAPELEARLVSATLQVAALDPERQSVSASAPTEWRWDVVAREGGPQELALSLYAIPPDQGSVRRIKTFERVISVHVPLVKRIASLASDHLEWMWSLILAPVGGWLYTRVRRNRGGQAPPPGSVQGR